MKNDMWMNWVRQQGKVLSGEVLGDDKVKHNVAAILDDIYEPSINNQKLTGKVKSDAHKFWVEVLVGIVNDPLVMEPIRRNKISMVEEMVNDDKIMGPITKWIVAPIAVPLWAMAAVYGYQTLRGK